MNIEFIVALLALAAGPISATVGYWLNRRTQESDIRLKFSEAQERMEGELWARMQKELARAYNRIDELSAMVNSLQVRVHQLEQENHHLLLENKRLKEGKP